MLKWKNTTVGRGDATTVTLYSKLYLNIKGNKKVFITVPEPLRNEANLSTITRDEDFLISHISSPREGIMWERTSYRWDLWGDTNGRAPEASCFSELHEHTAARLEGNVLLWNKLKLFRELLALKWAMLTDHVRILIMFPWIFRPDLVWANFRLKGTLLSTLKCICPIFTICDPA